MSGGRRAPRLPVGAAVTSRAAAEALGGGEQLAPLRPPALRPPRRPLPRPRVSPGLARPEGAEGAAVTAPATARALPGGPRSRGPASIRGCAGLAALARRGERRPEPAVLPAAERGSRKPAREPLGPCERGDLGRRVNLAESRRRGPRNGDERGASRRPRSLRRRECVPSAHGPPPPPPPRAGLRRQERGGSVSVSPGGRGFGPLPGFCRADLGRGTGAWTTGRGVVHGQRRDSGPSLASGERKVESGRQGP